MNKNMSRRMISCILAFFLLNSTVANGTEKDADNSKVKKSISYTQIDNIKAVTNEDIVQKHKKLEILKKNYNNLYIDSFGEIYESVDIIHETDVNNNKVDSCEETVNEEESIDWYSDEVIQNILEKYNISMFEFQVIVSVVAHEAAAGSYDDAYRVINTVLNRIHSYNWINYVKSVTGIDGKNPYAQAKCPGQFVVYNSKSGYDYDSTYGTPAFYATVDCLNTDISIHNNLSFKSNETQIAGERFTSKGNVYHNQMTESDTIDEVEIVDTVWDIVSSDMIHEMALNMKKEDNLPKKIIVKRLRLFPY